MTQFASASAMNATMQLSLFGPRILRVRPTQMCVIATRMEYRLAAGGRGWRRP